MRRKYLLLVLSIICLFAQAQNISVESFVLDEMDLTANQQGTIVMDQNGEKCALIRVKTTETGFTFDVGSLGVQKTSQKTAEIWVYVPHGIRKFNVSHQKYGSLEYALPVSIDKACTYICELKAETPLPVDHQRLSIQATPSNAVVMIDGNMVSLANGKAEVTLPLGTHKYVAMANGYYQQDGSIELKAERPGRLTVILESVEPNAPDAEVQPVASGTPSQAKNAAGPESNIEHEYVDLGLPSGTKWATCNVGAKSPEDIGHYFAWGETAPKQEFTKKNYTYSEKPRILPAERDAATANWGSKWKMPTKEQFIELTKYCKHKNTTQNGVKGRLFTSNNNGRTIFLPTGELRKTMGVYWSSSFNKASTAFALGWLSFGGQASPVSFDCSEGGNVRPVLSE